MPGFGYGYGFSRAARRKSLAPAVTVLTREADGSVTIESLGPTWSLMLERQPDGTVTVLYSAMVMTSVAGGLSISSAPDMGMPFTTTPSAGTIEVTNA